MTPLQQSISSPKFKNPIPKELVVNALKMFFHGDQTWFIAQNCKVSTGKISEIIKMYAEGAIPQPWLDEVKSGTEENWKSGDVDVIIE